MKEKLKKLVTSPALSRIWKWSRPVRLKLLAISILSVIISGIGLGVSLATRGLIDGATGHDRAELIRYALILTVLIVGRRLINYAVGIMRARSGVNLKRSLRMNVLHSLLNKEYANVSTHHSGDLIARLFGDVNTVCDGVMSIVPEILSMATALIGASVILISMDWRFVAVLIAGGVMALLLTTVFREPVKRRSKAVREADSKLHITLQEVLSNLRLVKASGSENRMMRLSEKHQDDLSDATVRKNIFSANINLWIGLVFQLSWLFAMLWGGFGIYRGTLTYGALASILQLVGQVQSPIAYFADVVAETYSMLTSGERLMELVDMEDEEQHSAITPDQLYGDLQSISFDSVDFCYERENYILKNTDFTIEKGDCVAITGYSGGGKSTMFQLLMGIYKPSVGTVSFNGLREKHYAGRAMRGLFAYVPQGNTLFTGTIAENIGMFNDDPTPESIRSAAKVACIDEFIESLDEGYGTHIGEHGLGLSEGQAQRVAVARAINSGAPILLLDEATSALDEKTEAELLKNISELQNKTCLIVTHRRAALAICDYRIHIGMNGADKIRTHEPPENV